MYGGISRRWQPVRDAFGEPNLTAHGLRRTARTGWSDIGIEDRLGELMLAHMPANAVERAYNKSSRLAERREAHDRWDAHLCNLIKEEPYNVD